MLPPIKHEIDERCNKCPQLTVLPEKAAIANAADLVLMVFRNEVYNTDIEDKEKANIIVSRNRDGFIGSIKLKFDERYGVFEEIS